MISEQFIQQVPVAPSFVVIVMLVVFFVLILVELFALYLRLAGFTVTEIVLLVALPFFIYLTALPAGAGVLLAANESVTNVVKDIAKYIDVPLFRSGNATVGINLVGFSIPVFISLKMLLQRRIPLRQTLLVVAIISVITYLLTRFEPEAGMVIYLFAISPILAAAIAFMLKKMKGASNFNPALLSYAGATLGILIGADIANLYRALTHRWDEAVFISIGGGSILDAIFLAGAVALVADVVFRSQEENILGGLVKLFTGDRHR